jgi:hypothetical protein
MLAGVWILVLVPLVDVLQASGWAEGIPAPSYFHEDRGTLDQTLLCNMGLYPILLFCIGVVLLFSKERGRRRNPLDWTRRWGVLCSYIVLLLSTAPILFISALVLAGIAALFMGMPLKYQPGVTPLFAQMSTAYLRYGPYPKDISYVVLIATSSITILLACIALYDALRSSGPKRAALILLSPLAMFSVLHLLQAGWYCLGFSSAQVEALFPYGVYFRPQQLAEYPAMLLISPAGWGLPRVGFVVEAAKWCAVLAIAVWLTTAQIKAWRGCKTSRGRIGNLDGRATP